MRLYVSPFSFALVTALMISAAALAAGGETKPDFSGTWILNPAKSRLEMELPTKMIWVIEHRDPKITMTTTRTWKEGSDMGSSDDSGTGTVTIDGEEHYKKDDEGESWGRHFWKGEELVWEWKILRGGEEGTIVVHYRLADGGKTFVAAEWQHTPGQVHHNLWVFDRAPEE
jgi:hypothetical protein